MADGSVAAPAPGEPVHARIASAAWLACRERRPGALARLYCFPHSGGSPGEYVRWSDGLPEIEVWGLQLPGRGRRLSEPSHRSLDDLVRAIVAGITFRPPFALFGHSLGALVAFETARALRDAGGPEPGALILSGYQPPHVPRTDRDVHQLPDEQLLPIVERQLGELSAELREDPELQQLTLDYYRADFEVVETYRYRDGPPLSVPLTVVGGTEDYSEEVLGGWQRHSTGPFTVHRLPGDHFYLREQRDGLLRLVLSAIARGSST